MSEKKNVLLSDNVQLVLTVISIIGIVGFLHKLMGKSDEEKSRDDSYRDIKPSYPDYMYGDFADTLDIALLREIDENENAVYRVFEQFKNISDLNKTIQAFGTRRKMFTLTWISLPAAIATFFSRSEKVKLNGILTKKGINYAFA